MSITTSFASGVNDTREVISLRHFVICPFPRVYPKKPLRRILTPSLGRSESIANTHKP